MAPLKRRVLYMLLAVTLGTSGCDLLRDYTEAEHIQRAKSFRDKGDGPSATIELRAALQKNPRNAEAHAMLGELYVAMQLGKEAEDELRSAMSMGASGDTLPALLGQAMLLQEKYDGVLAEIRPGPGATKRTVASVLDTRGRALLGLGRRADGCNLFDEAIAADQTYAPGHWGKAGCYVMARQLDAARAQLDIAAKADPKLAHTWVIIGDLERGRGRNADAETAYDKALEIDEYSVDAHLARAATRLARGKRDAANEDIDAVLAVSKDHPLAHHLRGVSYFYASKFADAKTEFETTLGAYPNYMPSVLWLGLTNVATQQYEQAAIRLATYIQANPREARIRALYALVQARLGGAKEVKEALAPLQGIAIDDPQSLAYLAQANILIGEYDAGARYFGKAVEVEPESARARVALAGALYAKGDAAGAIRELEKAFELDPAVAGADELMILALTRQKEIDKALQAADRFVAKQPKNALAHNYRGGVLLMKGEIAAAKQAYERALAIQPGFPLAARNLAALAVAQNDAELARKYYRQVLEHDKGNLETLMDLYRLELGANREQEALAWLDEAVKRNPQALEPVVLTADRYIKAGQPMKALEVTRALAAAKPDDPLVLEIRGAAYLAARDTASALSTYERWVLVEPQSARAHLQLGSVQLAAGNTREAARSFARASALDPAMVEPRLGQASIELRAGRTAEAMQIAQQIQKQAPASADGPALEGDVLMAQNKFLAAASAYERAYAMARSLPVAGKVYAAYAKAQRPEIGTALLEKRLQQDPNDTRTRLFLANTMLEAGRYDRAIAHYETLLAQLPDNVVVLNNLANAAMLGNDPRALEFAERAYKAKPDSAGVQDTLGWVLLQRGGDPQRSLELLQKAHGADPTNGDTHYHFAAALAAAGENERAKRELTALLASGRAFPAQGQAKALLAKL